MSGPEPPAPPVDALGAVVLAPAGALLPPWLVLELVLSEPRAPLGGLLALHALKPRHASVRHRKGRAECCEGVARFIQVTVAASLPRMLRHTASATRSQCPASGWWGVEGEG